jgi:hypothetical protein
MTFKEFLEFISQSSGHFVGFLIVLAILTEFVYRTVQVIFKYLARMFDFKEKEK